MLEMIAHRLAEVSTVQTPQMEADTLFQAFQYKTAMHAVFVPT